MAGIETVRKLLPREARVLDLSGFLREFAPSVAASNDEAGRGLPPPLRELLVAPLPTCPILRTAAGVCRESVRALVDGAVCSLVRRRETLRCRQQHRLRQTRKRKRQAIKSNNNNNNSHNNHNHNTTDDPRHGGRNALVHGFAVSREGDPPPPHGMHPGIAYKHPNENVTFCRSSPVLRQLHERVGDDVLRAMLLHTRCFWPMPRGHGHNNSNNGSSSSSTGASSNNYILLWGPPLPYDSNHRIRTHAASPAASLHHPETAKPPTNRKRNRKRRRSFPSGVAVGSPLHANESISRFHLLYCDSYVPRVTLPKSHPFPQRLERQKQRQQHQQQQQRQQQKQHHQQQQTLPDDYNFLLNVIFELHLENKNKQRRMRRRLGRAGRIVCEQFWKNYSSCHDYGRILHRCCPLPEAYRDALASQHSSHRLAMLAHAFAPKEGIVSFLSSVLNQVFPQDFWGSERNFRGVLDSVRSFVHLRRHEKLTNKTLMHGISVTSMKWLYNHAPHHCRRPGNRAGKQRTNHEAATELTLQALRWVFKGFLIPLLRSCFYVTETEFSARELHYYRKPVWALFRNLSFQKLTTRETTGGRPSRTPGGANPHFRIVSRARALANLRQQRMGVSRLRLLPKATGVRPIAQLSRSARLEVPPVAPAASDPGLPRPKRRKANPGDASVPVDNTNNAMDLEMEDLSWIESESAPTPPQLPSVVSRLPTNTILESVLDVLTYECGQRHRPFGNGLGNLREFYVRYRDYIARYRQQCAGNPRSAKQPQRLFFAKVDIEKCYDRIHQDFLLDLVERLVLHNTYVVQVVKMGCANLAAGGDNAHRFKKIVETVENYQPFHHREHAMARERKNTVFELLKCSLAEKPNVLELLREHLLRHMVVSSGRFDEKLLLQSRGISQGSTLSMLLCNLYYGTVENLMLHREDDEPEEATGEDLVSRFVDDFLFISPSQDSFQRFLDKTHRGKPELGARINPGKTLVNTKATITLSSDSGGRQEIVLPQSNRCMNNGRKVFPWCGLLFDTDSGEVLVDYERFYGGKLRQSLTIDFDGSEGEKLAQRLRAFLFPRCLPILYDSSINSFATIATNYYQMMLFGACKTGEYIRGQNATAKTPKARPTQNADFLLRCIRGLARYAIKNIRSKSKVSLPDREGRTKKIDRREVFSIDPTVAAALSLQAFCDVFEYLSAFADMVRILRHESLVYWNEISHKKRGDLRRILARAWDDFRINRMIDKLN